MLNRYLQRLPMWALVPIMFVLVGAMYYGLSYLTRLDHTQGERLFGAGVYAVVFTLAFSIRIAVQRRRAGGAGEPARISAAVRTGTLPDEVDPAHWRAELERQRTLFRRNRWSMPIIMVVFAVVCGWLAFQEQPLWLVLLLILVVLAVVSLFQTRRALRNIPTLLEALSHRPDPRALSDGAPQPTPGAHWPTPDER